MTTPVVPGGRVPSRAPSSHHAAWTTHRTLETWATLIVAVSAVLVGGIAAVLEDPAVAPLVLVLGATLVAVLVVAWRWPVAGGVLVALLGLWQEWTWFTGQLEGDVQAFLDSLGSVSPHWFAIPAAISGAMFVAAEILPKRRRS